MSKYFEGKKVWITGASSGIGEALAIAISERGGFVILTARSQQKLEAVQQSLKHPEHSEIVTIDLMNAPDVDAKAKAVIHKHKDLFMLINNAGRSQRSKVEETEYQVYKDLMELNYFSIVKLTKQVLPNMIAQRQGHLIAISSIAGKLGAPYRSGYAASKHAIQGFFDCLRSEVHHHNINVSLICPGYVNTQIAHNAMSSDGTALGKADPDNANGMSPEYVANKICDAASKGKEELILGGTEKMGVYLKRFFPRILSRVLKNKSKAEYGS